MIGARDARALALLFAAVVAALAPVLFCGWSYFWGDLSYLHYPWKTLVAEALVNGRLPLWNPYNYLGMPLLGNFQSGALYPGGLPFAFFPFARALDLYLLAHLALTGTLTFLWLRALGLRRSGALLAATAWSLGGVTFGHLPFLNHIGSLCWFPAMLLFARRPLPLALAVGLCLSDGYPTFAAGQAAAALLLAPWLSPGGRGGKGEGRWPLLPFAAACGLGAAAAAAMLLPSVELTLRSVRAAGLDADVTLNYSLRFADLKQFLSPVFLGKEFSPPILWWKTVYWSLAASAAGAAGVYFLARERSRRGAVLAVYGLGVLVLALGDSWSVSKWLWLHLPPLRFIRYPGNLLYLLLPAQAFWTAYGLQRSRWARLAWLLAAVELVLASWSGQPAVTRDYYSDPGPLAVRLQSELSGERYLLSPKALEWSRGQGSDFLAAVRDFRRRLYGLTNAPAHLAAVGNFGEPLVPAPSYEWMDFLYRRPGVDATAPYLPLAGASILLTQDRYETDALQYEGRTLWQVYRFPGPVSRAYASAGRLPAGLTEPSGVLQPVAYSEPREDRFEASGDSAAGWIYVANPLYPGWKGWSGGRELSLEPAYGAFLQFAHAGGPFRAVFRYDPASWTWGLLGTLASLMGLSLYCYNRLLRISS